MEQLQSLVPKEEKQEGPDCKRLLCCSVMTLIGICGAICGLLVAILLPMFICMQTKSSQLKDGLLMPDGGITTQFNIMNMTVMPDEKKWARLSAKYLTGVYNPDPNYPGLQVGSGSASRMPHLMYEATKVPGVWEHVPDKLKGVFWMQGNPLAEVLCTNQYGKWFEHEQVFLRTRIPWDWTWYDHDAPSGYTLAPPKCDFGPMPPCEGSELIMKGGIGGWFAVEAMSFKFSKCPKWAKCRDIPGEMTYAELQIHNEGKLTTIPPWQNPTSRRVVLWTMEEMEDAPQPGSLWYRRTNIWCDCKGFGSYYLKKVIDKDGNKVQPYFDEFVKFMEGNNLLVWSNWSSPCPQCTR